MDRRPNRLAFVFLIAGLAAACGDPSAATRSSGIAWSGAGAAGIAPSAPTATAHVSPMPVPLTPGPTIGFGCPLLQPFSTNFNLVIQDQSGPLALNQVSFQFVNGASVTGSPLLMSAADLQARFGSTTITPGIVRVFNFQPQFGCGISQPNSFMLTAVLLDDRAQAQQIALTVPIH